MLNNNDLYGLDNKMMCMNFDQFAPPGKLHVGGGPPAPGLHALWESVFMKMEQEPEQLRNRGRPKEDKYCGVCGDKALGYNFDAISCESCKAFFRRNAPKGLEYFKCPYDEKCKMDVSNRRFCKRCRLKKCFDIGMRKEYILSEEEKNRKRQKIEENRKAREKPMPTSPPINNNNSQYQMTIPSAEMQQHMGFGAVQRSLPSASSLDESPSGSPTDVTMELDGVEENLAIPLCDDDCQQIDEIVAAYRSALDVCTDDLPPPDQKNSINDLVNVCEVSIRRVIDMAKKIQSFKSLPQFTQISLLKGGSIELLIIRSVLAFDIKNQSFLDQHDNPNQAAMTLDDFRTAAMKTNAMPGTPTNIDPMQQYSLVEDVMKFVKVLAIDLQADETTLVLLLLICLFSPDRPNLDLKDVVALEQERFSLLLQHYMESRYPLSEGRLLYAKLLMKLTDIRDLNEESSQVFLNLSRDSIQPLMKEVLDLKTPQQAVGSPMSTTS